MAKIKAEQNTKDSSDIVFDLFGEIGVESFVVTFDGGGDSGQIEEAGEFKPAEIKKKADKLMSKVVEGARYSNGTRWSPEGGQETMWVESPKMSDLIGGLCYEMLESVWPGWEINEGSHGTFFFDVKKRKVTLDFNERIVDSRNHEFVL